MTRLKCFECGKESTLYSEDFNYSVESLKYLRCLDCAIKIREEIRQTLLDAMSKDVEVK